MEEYAIAQGQKLLYNEKYADTEFVIENIFEYLFSET